jgi:HNH endonuclease
MSDRYRLVALRNEEFVAALSSLVRRESALLSDMLAHLAELDERRLYLELGFTSMFAYCTDALGLCKSSAYRRIAAARVCRRYPEVFPRVAAGELQTSVLAALSRHLTPDNADELLAVCSRKSCEQVEELLAMRFPRPDVPDSIRRLPARPVIGPRSASSSMGNPGPNDPTPSEVRSRGAVTVDPPVLSAPDCSIGDPSAAISVEGTEGRTLAVDTVDPPEVRAGKAAVPVQQKLEPLSSDRFGVHFTADGEFKRLLEEVRALASHRQPNGDLLSLMTLGLEAYRRELLKARYGVGRKARRTERLSVNSSELASGVWKRSRHVPAAVAREVYLRDGGCCTFYAASGRRCGARRFLEIDHVTPWAEHGESTVENLRLRCRAHNQHTAREHFGVANVGAAIAACAMEK